MTDAVPALGSRLMQRRVGFPVQAGIIRCPALMNRNSDRHAERGSRERHALPREPRENSGGDVFGRLRIAIRRVDQEIIAKPRTLIVRTNAPLDRIGRAGNDRAAGRMPAHIVDHLEIVDVDQQQSSSYSLVSIFRILRLAQRS